MNLLSHYNTCNATQVQTPSNKFLSIHPQALPNFRYLQPWQTNANIGRATGHLRERERLPDDNPIKQINWTERSLSGALEFDLCSFIGGGRIQEVLRKEMLDNGIKL